MTTDEFNQIVMKTLEQAEVVLVRKAQEYATEDRLHNFNVAARILGTSRREALAGMMVKHLVSVFDIIKDVRPVDEETLDEKIGDTINYLILLKAIVLEENKNGEADTEQQAQN